MKIFFTLLSCFLLSACVGGSAKDPRWGKIKTPSEGQSEAIGTYNAGCLAGAKALPMQGRGFQVMRASRNRYYAHPSLMHFIDTLGHFAAHEGKILSIGDLTQPRGGPMSSGHASHQIGLDADIWFWGTNKTLSPQERENIAPKSLVGWGGRPKEWQPYYQQLLRYAAEQPEVDRIFVNPAIKQKLCETSRGAQWLGKIRPWRGHDAHFHVRLRCPAGDSCNGQPAVDDGDGCDALAQQLKKIKPAAEPEETEIIPERASAKPTLPPACEALIPPELK